MMKKIMILCPLVLGHLLIFAQNMGVKLPAATTPNTTLDVNGSTAYREGTALALSNGVNTDIALTDFSLFRITGPTAAFSITGFQGGQNGRVLTLINATSQTLTFTHQTVSASANQINTGGSPLVLGANGVATLIYNTTLTKWFVTGGQGFVPTGANNWALTGNSGTVDGTNFIGTTDFSPINFRINNSKAGRIAATGETFLGYLSGNSMSSGTHNTYIGFQTGSSTTVGSLNVALGSNALLTNTLGDNNTALGSATLLNNSTESNSTAVGYGALHFFKGNQNTAVGSNALYGSVPSTGNNNTAIGFEAGKDITTGSNNIAIGQGAQVPTASANNQLNIGNWLYGVNGAIGIGTSTPYAQLHVHGVGKSGYTPTSHGIAGVHGAEIAFSTSSFSKPAATIQLLNYNNFSSGLGFNVHKGTSNSGTGVAADNWPTDVLQAMTIDNRGYVGIGTTSPNAGLDIASNNNGLYNDVVLTGYHAADMPVFNIRRARGVEGAPTNMGNGDGIGGLHFYGYNNNTWNLLSACTGYYKGNGTTNLSDLQFMTSNSVQMVIDENGNMGVNCNSPQYKLHVVGNVGVTGTIRASGTITASTSITACSDFRFKKNFTPLSNALENVLKLRGVTYDWRTKEFPEWHFNDRKQIGVIAQELEKIYPELVDTDEKGFKTVDYSKMTPILVEAIKDLKNENDGLKAELAKIKADNSALKSSVEKNNKDIESIKAMFEKRQN